MTAKKYLIITNHSYMLWQFRRDLIEELLKSGEVVISTPFMGHVEGFKAMGCRMIETKLNRRGINPFEELKLYRFYKELIKQENPDLVITYSIKPNIYAGYVCRKLGIPYFVNVQGLGTAFQKRSISGIATRLYRTALKDARTVFFENTEIAKVFLHRKIIPQEKIMTLHGAGVNLEYFVQQPYPTEEAGIRFLYLGRIMKEKGVDEFFEASRQIKARYGKLVEFDLVGFFEDDYKETVEQLVSDKTEKFFGFQADPRPWYADTHCIVQPSYHEGMNNVLLEAAATGRALITTDISGCREAVLDGETGLLCQRADIESLVQCMERFLSMTTAERAAMGARGRKWMEQNFDRRDVVEMTVKALGIGI
ncbi:MAG: glycosyltransferase family 4 protein [Parasporobacterium sp.]|nr:glycosyltransferase family 4 protein [Parasporobacterium sp.]